MKLSAPKATRARLPAKMPARRAPTTSIDVQPMLTYSSRIPVLILSSLQYLWAREQQQEKQLEQSLGVLHGLQDISAHPQVGHNKPKDRVTVSRKSGSVSFLSFTHLTFRSSIAPVTHRVVDEVLLPQASSIPDAHQDGRGCGSLVRLVPVRDLPDDDARPQGSLRCVVVPLHAVLHEECEEHTPFPPQALAAEGAIIRVEHVRYVKDKQKNQDKPRRRIIDFYYPAKIADDPGRGAILSSHIKNAAKLVYQYSSLSLALGKHLEGLVKYELRVAGFDIVKEHAREYRQKRWTGREDIDIIARHRSSGLEIGVEVKNKLKVVQRNEVEKTLDICEFFGLVQVFAARWIAPHIGLIQMKGGHALTFGYSE